jgi:HAMP domain-containing protein
VAAALGDDESATEWWQEAWDSSIYVSDAVYDDASELYMIIFAAIVHEADTSDNLGVLMGRMLFATNTIVERYANEIAEGRVVIFDKDGGVLADTADPERHLNGTVTMTEVEESAIDRCEQGNTSGYVVGEDSVAGFAVPTAEGAAQMYTMHCGSCHLDVESHPTEGAGGMYYTPGYDGVGWTVIAEQPKEVAFAPLDGLVALEEDLSDSSNTMMYTLGAVLLAMVLAGLGMAFWLTRSITKPVTELRDVADRVSQGDMGVQVPEGSDDEIGDLAESFSRMVAAVKFLQMEDEGGQSP